MKDTLILQDGSIIELEAGASLYALPVISDNKSAMVATWDKLTESNLSAIQVKNGDGLVVGNYTDLVLASETSIVRPDGTILTTYSLREKTDIELLTERMAAVEEGQQVQDGAISDLGEVASVLAEQLEGGVQ